MPWSDVENAVPPNMRIAAQTYGVAVLMVGILFLIVSGGMLVYAIRTPRPMPMTPIVYEQDEYTPNKIDLCPKDSLEVDIYRTIRRKAGVSNQVTWYDVTAGAPALRIEPEGPYGVTPDSGKVHRLLPLPAEVRALGHQYEYRLTAWEGGPKNPESQAVGYKIPFRLKAFCP
jgi:hypothetical protein